jgi:hypothetical protein
MKATSALRRCSPGYENMSKYKAKATTIDGIRFPSKAEARRYFELKVMLGAGLISDLELQPSFPVLINGIKVFTYRGDFQYRDQGGTVVEDVKGFLTPVYRLKKRCVEAFYPGTVIMEVR